MSRGTQASDVRAVETEVFFSLEAPRAAFAFGGAVAGELTLCHVRVRVENRVGQVADGWGAIFLSHPWAFPTAELDGPTKDQLMRRLVERTCRRVTEDATFAHPVDIFWQVQPELGAIALEASRELGVTTPVPPLAGLVCAAPIDAALHDAFGQVNRLSTYDGYGPDSCQDDLSRYLGETFRGRYLRDYLRANPAPAVPVAHTVGGLDPLTPDEQPDDVPDDGLPHTLADWIARDGLRAFKVKLLGKDLRWDLDRLIAVHRVAKEGQRDAGQPIHLSADLNEQCQDADYVLEYLARLRDTAPGTFAALQYVEQPVPRDQTGTAVDLSAVAALKPVVLDEGLTSLEDIMHAHALGWTGIALKTCKTQSLMLLALALAAEHAIGVTVQDLSNPGLALLQSIGLAARLPVASPMEANGRQFFPAASAPEASVHADVFRVRDGVVATASLRGPGFGYQVDRVDRPIFRVALPA